ncbi:hypothetical protein KQI82_10080 [Oscillibacter sp. MSJ-2]|uniref:DUF2892 domain-containing protein n=1 Tax=Dysosmobacter acutus TaxID=2841504 RepID=A0ABS6FAD7_9FIRM|nr:hypothetical protein [Dysosmobacter acutus]MBU5627255.1 hypothetical protein [Dysosmobacter acutus]
MKRAIICALIVLAAGYFGCILGVAGCMIAVGATMTGCIIYELEDIRAERKPPSE